MDPSPSWSGHCLVTVEVQSDFLLIKVTRRWFENPGDYYPVSKDRKPIRCTEVDDALAAIEEFLQSFTP